MARELSDSGLIDALPINSGQPLQYTNSHEFLNASRAIILEIAVHQLQEILAELINALRQTFSLASNTEGLLDSQVYIIGLISECLDQARQGFQSGRTTLPVLEDSLASEALVCYGQMAISLTHGSGSSNSETIQNSRPKTGPKSVSRLSLRTSSQDSRKMKLQQYEALVDHFATLVSSVSWMNWSAALRTLCTLLAQPYLSDEETDFNHKIRYLSHFSITASTVDSLLNTVQTYFQTFLISTQLELASSLHGCLSNWLLGHPEQISLFRQNFDKHRLSTGQKLFDTLYVFVDSLSNMRRATFWPLLAILATLYYDDSVGTEMPKKSKQVLFFQHLNSAMATKMCYSCLDSYTHILTIMSHLPDPNQSYCGTSVTNIISVISRIPGVLRDGLGNGSFTLAPQFFCALFRLNSFEAISLALTRLDLWLSDHDKSLPKAQAVQCVAAIFADTHQPHRSDGMEKLLRIASLRIKLPFLAAQAFEKSQSEPNLSPYILDMFCTAPEVMLADQNPAEALKSVLALCLSQDQFSVSSTAGKLLCELQSPTCVQGEIFGKKLHEHGDAFYPIWCRFSLESIQVVVRKLSSTQMSETTQLTSLLIVLSSMLCKRAQTLRLYSEQLGNAMDDLEFHLAARETVEIGIMRIACHVSTTIVTLAIEAGKPFIDEALLYRKYYKTSALLDNMDLYTALFNEHLVNVGRNAAQKRIRDGLLEARETFAMHKVWLEVYDIWSKVTDDLFGASQPVPFHAQDALMAWQNYTGFLAASARCNGADYEGPVYTFISRFREVFMQSRIEFVSEICAEIIGNALHISLYSPMLLEIQKLIQTIKDKKGVLIVRSRSTILIEQLIIICRGLFERLESFIPFQEGLNIGEIMLDLAQYLELCEQSYVRSRLRFCQLCEIFAARYDLMCMLGETSIRRRLCNYLSSWLMMSSGTNTDLEKISKDTNAACLRALAQLTRNLHFGPEAQSIGRQVAADVKSLIQTFLPLASMTESEAVCFSSAPLQPILVELLSNVLAVNQLAAMKPFISLCYHASCSVSAIFSSTLAHWLKLENGMRNHPTMEDLESQLWALVTTDGSILTAMLDGCPTPDGPLEILLDHFLDQGSVPALFSLVLGTEVAICKQETELFRRNSPSTRLFAAYVKRCGEDFVTEVLGEPLSNLSKHYHRHSTELDPTKLDTKDSAAAASELMKNQAHLLSSCQEFIDAICNSLTKLPSEFLAILQLVGNVTARKYAQAAQKSIGSFLILRYFGPAIVQSSGGCARLQRQLVLIVKILTNLANKTYFKEGHLVVLNGFLQDNIQRLSTLFDQISGSSDPVQTANTMQFSLIPAELSLQQHFQKHADRIRNKLVEICLKQECSVNVIRTTTSKIRQILCYLGEHKATTNLEFLSSLEEESRLTTGSATPTGQMPVMEQTFRHIGYTQGQRPLYYLELAKFGTYQAATVMNLCASLEIAFAALAEQRIELFLDVTGFSLGRFSHNSQIPDVIAKVLISPHTKDLVIHMFNVNHAFATFLRTYTGGIWSRTTTRKHFIDHTDTLEHYFDQSACLQLAKMHGLLIRSYPHELCIFEPASYDSQLADGFPIHLSFSSDDSLLLTSLDQKEVVDDSKSKLVERLVVQRIEGIQVEQNTLVIKMRNRQSIYLRPTDPLREMQTLELFMVQAISQFRTDSHIDIHSTNALLLCVALTRIASADSSSRASGARILTFLLPARDLQKLGLLSVTAATVTALGHAELHDLHQLTHRKASVATRILFLEEVLARIPYVAASERHATLACLSIWLADIGVYSEDASIYIDVVHRVLRSLLNLHALQQDLEVLLSLWKCLDKSEPFQTLLYEHLLSYALRYEYDSQEVTKVCQILRELKSPNIITRLSTNLVSIINAKRSPENIELTSTTQWSAATVTLRLLVDITDRTATVIESLPELSYSIIYLLNLGSLGIRKLVYELMINVASAATCFADVTPEKRAINYETVEVLQSLKMQQAVETGSAGLLEHFSKQTLHSLATQYRELTAADHFTILTKSLVDLIKNSSRDKYQETPLLQRFSQYVADAAFRKCSRRRRAYLALGILSYELQLTTVQPLVDALLLELDNATSQDSRQALSVVVSLSLTKLPNPCMLTRLSLLLCTLPLPAVATGGLRLLTRCLHKIQKDQSVLTLSSALALQSDAWNDYQMLVGINIASNMFLGMTSVLLQSLKITRDRESVKAVLCGLVELHHTTSTIEEPTKVGPVVMLLCAISETTREIRLVLEKARVEYRDCQYTVAQLICHLFEALQMPDDDQAIPFLCIFLSLLSYAENTEEKIKALTCLAVSAKYMPQAFQTIYSDLEDYLQSVFEKSTHLPLLNAARSIVVANQALEAQRLRQPKVVPIPNKNVVLHRLGFASFTTGWNHGNDDSQLVAHRRCIKNMIGTRDCQS